MPPEPWESGIPTPPMVQQKEFAETLKKKKHRLKRRSDEEMIESNL